MNIDDCWQWSRDADGTIQPEQATFPNGIPALVDYVHSRKLKFGLYSGTKMILGNHILIIFSMYQIEDIKPVLVDLDLYIMKQRMLTLMLVGVSII